jgi:ribosome-binding factor A
MPKVEQLQTVIQRTVADILQREVKSELGFLTVTGVKLTNELSFLTIYYTVFGDDKQKTLTKENLERAKPFVRTMLASRVKLRKMPELVFQYDSAADRGEVIDKLIRSIH